MRILVLGATGVLGRAVCAALSMQHEIVEASRSRAAHRADLCDEDSLLRLFDQCGALDAVVCTAGETPFRNLAAFLADDLCLALREKLFGQIAFARIALSRLRARGSITLTGGILNHRPIPHSTAAAMANGALEGFVKAAAVEIGHGPRINLVSPSVLEESWPRYGRFFAGFRPVPAAVVALAYRSSIEGLESGRVFSVH